MPYLTTPVVPTVASSWIKTIEASARRPLRYQAVYRDENGRQRSAGVFATKKEAKSALANVLVATESGTWVDPSLSKTTVSAYAERWLAGKQVTASTAVRLEGEVRRMILPTFADMQLKQIRPTDVRAWVVELGTKFQPSTVRLGVGTFRSMMNQAVEDGYLSKNPVKLGQGDLPRKTPSLKMFLTLKDIERLIEATDPHYRMLVSLTAWTGMRWQEVAALRWSDVDFDAATVTVERVASRGPGGRTYYDQPKTPSSQREISLDKDTLLDLRKHRLATRGNDLVFTTTQGAPINDSAFRMRVWNPACVKAFAYGLTGLQRSCETCIALPGAPCVTEHGKEVDTHRSRYGVRMPTFHDLRHTHISHLLVAGVDPVTVSRRAGHSSPVMTLSVYGRLRPDHVAAVNTAIASIKKSETA